MDIPIDQEMVEIMQQFPDYLQWSLEHTPYCEDENEEHLVKIIQEYHTLTNKVWAGGFAIPGAMVDLMVLYPPNNKNSKPPTRYFLCEDNQHFRDQPDKLKAKISVPVRHARGNGADVLILTEYVD